MATESMRAARYWTSGASTGALEIVELERPAPGPGEVLVRLSLSGVNPTDWKSRLPGGMTASGLEWVVPNQDGAGEITAVGQGVPPERIGERVWVYLAQWQRPQGTAAEWIALPSKQAVLLPHNASLELGAGLGIPALTAHRCLFSDGNLAGAHVLVQGGAGAVGHSAIELAVWNGAHVAATVSSAAKAELALAAGAELVLNYRTEDVVEAVRAWAPDGVARIIEVDLVQNLEADAAMLAGEGVISSYAASTAAVPVTRELMTKNALIQFVLVYTMPSHAKERATADISAALAEDAMTSLPMTRFSLDEITAAHDAVRGGVVGKVLVDVAAG